VTAGLSVVTFIQTYTKASQTEEARELRAAWLFKLNTAHQTAYSISDLIVKDEITKRYYRNEENTKDARLHMMFSNYIADLINVFPDVAEISLYLADGQEDIRVAFDVSNQKEIQRSEIISRIFEKPHHDVINIEIHEDFEAPVLRFYRGIEMLSEIKSPQRPVMQTVATVRMTLLLDQVFSSSTPLPASQLGPMLIDDSGKLLYSSAPEALSEEFRTQAMNATQGIFTVDGKSWFVDRYEWRPGILLLSILELDALSSDIAEAMIALSFSGLLVLLLLPLALGLLFRHMVLLPLYSLVRAADDTESDIDSKHLNRDDEIGILLKAFATMRKSLIQQNLALRNQVYKDGLTGLPNRNALPHILEESAKRSRKLKIELALMFLDLDGFKQVNDAHGHSSGDLLLKLVAERVSGQLRNNDQLYHFLDDEMSLEASLVRLGGDEFTVVLPDIRSRSNARKVAHRIISSMESPFDLEGAEVFVGCSIGISLFPSDTADLEELIQFADAAMYEAKRRGKMQAVLYDGTMHNSEMAQMEISKVLHHAVTNDEVESWFQPKIDPVTNRIHGFEALARIQSKKFGFISPAKFIPIAERSPMIDVITLRCLENCCRLQKHLEIEFEECFQMSLNLSPRQFSNRELFEQLNETVQRYDVDPKSIEFEVTETSIMEYKDLGKDLLKTLKGFGFKTSLDDFGTGYSSLGHLHDFPVDSLKIDRLFFENIEDRASQSILESVLQLARNLNLTVVAEGIETAEQMKYVQDREVDLVQGYIYSRPLQQSDVIEFVRLFKQTQNLKPIVNATVDP
jgi:diguanylate cyclase (GGDEF)-like protein